MTPCVNRSLRYLSNARPRARGPAKGPARRPRTNPYVSIYVHCTCSTGLACYLYIFGRFTMAKAREWQKRGDQRSATWLRDRRPRQLSIHNVYVLPTSRPPRPWYLHDVAGRKSPSTKWKWVPARQLQVLEPENFPPNLRPSHGKKTVVLLVLPRVRFAFSAKDWSYMYCRNMKRISLRKPPWQALASCNPKIKTFLF